jgi:hypothetical protein
MRLDLGSKTLTLAITLATLAFGCGGGASPASMGAAGTGVAGTSGGAGTTGSAGSQSGNAGAGGGVTQTPPPQALPAGGMDACAAFVKATCAKRDSCSANGGTALMYGDAATCQSRELPKCLATLTAGGTSKTPALLMACTSSLAQQTCVDYFDNVLTAACTPKPGTSANGAACISSWQCASAFCSLAHTGVCGVCGPRPTAGASCAQTICGSGLLCHSSTMTCEVAGAAGAACDKTMPCAAGLACVGNTATVKGSCKLEGSMVGVTCDPKSATAPGCNKDVGLYCDAATMKCVAFGTATAGQPCGLVAGKQVLCTAGGLCVGGSATTAGTCSAAAKDAAACSATNGPPCLAPAKCVAGVCALPDPSTCR